MKRIRNVRVLFPTVLHTQLAKHLGSYVSTPIQFDFYNIDVIEYSKHLLMPSQDPLIRNGAIVFKSFYDKIIGLSDQRALDCNEQVKFDANGKNAKAYA